MSVLRNSGLIQQPTMASRVFEELVPDFAGMPHQKPSTYVSSIWELYSTDAQRSANLNGAFFELTIATLFVREGLVPLHIQAKLAFVPNAIYDLMLITAKNVPIAFSLKTSLRERYKQADLEGIVLKNVHRKAKNILITLDEGEARGVKRKIEDGDVVGLDQAIVATQQEFDALIDELKTDSYISASTVELIVAQRTASG